MLPRALKLGTRRSALARAQSTAVAQLIEQLHPGPLRPPLRKLPGQRLVLAGRDYGCFSIAPDRRLLVVLLHGRLARC